MTRAIGIRLLSIAAIVAIAGVLLYSLPMNLGLDLQGGVQVVLEAQDTETAQVNDDAMERAHAVIDRRVNALGVSEPVIQRQGSRRIIVELPGIDDHEQAIDAIGRTALLEFKDPLGNTILTGSSLRNASVTRDEMGRWAIAIEFDREGTQVFAELTRRWVNTGRGLPIVFDGEEIIAPMVSNVILDGQGTYRRLHCRGSANHGGSVAIGFVACTHGGCRDPQCRSDFGPRVD